MPTEKKPSAIINGYMSEMREQSNDPSSAYLHVKRFQEAFADHDRFNLSELDSHMNDNDHGMATPITPEQAAFALGGWDKVEPEHHGNGAKKSSVFGAVKALGVTAVKVVSAIGRAIKPDPDFFPPGVFDKSSMVKGLFVTVAFMAGSAAAIAALDLGNSKDALWLDNSPLVIMEMEQSQGASGPEINSIFDADADTALKDKEVEVVAKSFGPEF